MDTLLRRELVNPQLLTDDRLLASKYGAAWTALTLLRLPGPALAEKSSAVAVGRWRQRELAKADAVERLVGGFLQQYRARVIDAAESAKAGGPADEQVRALVQDFHAAGADKDAAARAREALLFVSGKTVGRIERELGVDGAGMYADEGAGSKWKHAVRRRDLRVRERAKRALEEVEKATKRTRRLLHGAGGEEEE